MRLNLQPSAHQMDAFILRYFFPPTFTQKGGPKADYNKSSTKQPWQYKKTVLKFSGESKSETLVSFSLGQNSLSPSYKSNKLLRGTWATGLYQPWLKTPPLSNKDSSLLIRGSEPSIGCCLKCWQPYQSKAEHHPTLSIKTPRRWKVFCYLCWILNMRNREGFVREVWGVCWMVANLQGGAGAWQPVLLSWWFCLCYWIQQGLWMNVFHASDTSN